MYHKSLVPEQFGEHFGLGDQDVQKLTSWLESQGFSIDEVSQGRTTIEFSGTAGQVQNTFVYDSSLNNSASVIQWGNSEAPAQKWMLVQVEP